MRRPPGVVIAGLLLGVLAFVGVVAGVAALSVSAIVHRPLLPKIPGVRPGLWLMVAFSLFCLWTVAGLFRMRPWTRPAMVAIGLVVLVVSSAAGAGLLWTRDFVVMIASALSPTTVPDTVQTILYSVAGFYFLIALAGLWWSIAFSRARIKAAFAPPLGVALPPAHR